MYLKIKALKNSVSFLQRDHYRVCIFSSTLTDLQTDWALQILENLFQEDSQGILANSARADASLALSKWLSNVGIVIPSVVAVACPVLPIAARQL